MIKKFLSLLLAVCLCCTLAGAAFAESDGELTEIDFMYMSSTWKPIVFGDDPVTQAFMDNTGVKLITSAPSGDVVVHSNGGVARASVAVQDDAHIIGKLAVLAIERVVQHGRRDLVAVKDLLVDIAVQVNRSQVRSPPFPVPTRCLREQKRRTVPRRYFRTP